MPILNYKLSRRLLLLCGMMLVCLQAQAEERAWQPFLYAIETSPTCYLLGTIHLPDDRVRDFPPELQEAFDQADRVYNEIPMSAQMQTLAAMAMMDLTAEPLPERLPHKTYLRVKAELEKYGMPILGFDKMRTWAIAVSLPLLEFTSLMQTKPPLDVIVYEHAKAAGKVTGGLERIDDQLSVFGTLSDDEQVRFLEAVLDQLESFAREGKSPVEDLAKAYFAGDEEALKAVIEEQDSLGFDEDDPLAKRLMEALMTRRDENFANRIAKLIELYPEQSQFFAIGAAHLLSEESVIDRLREKGFGVYRLEPAIVSE